MEHNATLKEGGLSLMGCRGFEKLVAMIPVDTEKPRPKQGRLENAEED